MADIYDTRLKNAQHIFASLQKLLDEGYLIFDSEGEQVKKLYVIGDPWQFGSENEDGTLRFMYYDHDKDWDHGRYTTIAEFNARFAKWKVVNPLDIKSIF
jgi:hypothetical protein